MTHLSALPVLVPFLAGPLLVAVGSFAPRWFEDSVAGVSAVAVTALCVLLAVHAATQPFAYWVGGLRPRGGVAVGISLSVDPLGAGTAGFAALLVSAALAYSLRYFDAVKGLYHGLMLLFMAGMVGFCLTGDLFNLVVFFELMSAAAYALTAYRIEERGPIQGAINFAVTNSIGGYAMFVAVGMLYARTGALNLAQMGAALDGHPADPLVIVAMVLLLVGFLTKAAAVPLHFWLADAHAVAPTPVCVLFSGVMVELGLYAVVRLIWEVFAGPLSAHHVALRAVLVGLGTVTAALGSGMCVVQRHVKRLLAFSTIAHVGMFVCGIGLLNAHALAGVFADALGHGLVKAALFMCVGVLLHRFASVDEYDLHGRGREVPLAGVLMAAGAVLLAGVPLSTVYFGKSLLEEATSDAGYGWLIAVFLLCSALTAGAILRVAARVFLGWGAAQAPDAGQARAGEDETDEERQTRDRTPVTMLIVPALLLALAAVAGLVPGLVPGIERQALRFTDHGAYHAWVMSGGAPHWPVLPHRPLAGSGVLYGALSVLGAVAVAGAGLWGQPLRERLPRALTVPLRAVRALHSGHIGDYIAWWTAGTAALGGICLLALR